MNAMNEIVLKMAQEEERYSETLQKHELKIEDLERELRLLKLKKSLLPKPLGHASRRMSVLI